MLLPLIETFSATGDLVLDTFAGGKWLVDKACLDEPGHAVCAASAWPRRTAEELIAGIADRGDATRGLLVPPGGRDDHSDGTRGIKTALVADLLARVIRKIPDNLSGTRDKALLLVMFGAALRRGSRRLGGNL